MINHVVYHYFQAADRGETYVMPPELPEEEQLAVAVLISQEEERRAFPRFKDALALSVMPPHHLGHHRCSRRRLHQRGHAATPGWSPGTRGLELCLGGRRHCRRSLVGLPRRKLHRQPPGPPPPPMANWSWASVDDDDDNGQA
jgi:hypothetical protein